MDRASIDTATKIQTWQSRVRGGYDTEEPSLAHVIAAGKADLVEAAVAVVSTVPGGTLHARALDGLLAALARHREAP